MNQEDKIMDQNDPQNGLHTWDIVAVILYFVVIFGVGVSVSKQLFTKTIKTQNVCF